MDIRDFDYDLPEAAIAQEPLPERDASRLLVLGRREGTPRHHQFRDLPDLLAPGDLVVLNRSRVFAARLLGHRTAGGKAEVLLLRRTSPSHWEALLRPGRRLRAGDSLDCGGSLRVLVEPGGLPDGRRLVRLESGAPDGEIEALLDRLGHMPLPPYIKRPDGERDRERYQTVYARETGSVAAPTAGLHFTPSLLALLRQRGVETAEIVLHVGPGTFRPVKTERVEDHRLAAESYSIPRETAEAVARTRARAGRVVAVGTTTARTLEFVARETGVVAPGEGETDLMIAPGFSFRVVDALITNFHLPRSSLLLLVSAFAGRDRVLDAYAEALSAGYRFYSYGDAMLLL